MCDTRDANERDGLKAVMEAVTEAVEDEPASPTVDVPALEAHAREFRCVAFRPGPPPPDPEREPLAQDFWGYLGRNPLNIIALILAAVCLLTFMAMFASGSASRNYGIIFGMFPFGIVFAVIASYFITDWIAYWGRGH